MIDHPAPTHAPILRGGGALLIAALVAACGGAVGSATPSAIAPSAVATSAVTGAPSVAPSETPSVAPSAAAVPTPEPSDGRTAGQVRTDALGIEQVWVPAGTFTMGTDAAAIATLAAELAARLGRQRVPERAAAPTTSR